jgi:peptidoglycan/LPS O-acetylase OafA/YrhL
MLASVGLYLFLLEVGDKIRGELAIRCIEFAARHSFTVYLIHMMILMPLSRVLPVQSGFASLGMFVVLASLTLIASLALAAALDFALVRPVQRFFDILVEKIKVVCKEH